jgi:hypothetical protein
MAVARDLYFSEGEFALQFAFELAGHDVGSSWIEGRRLLAMTLIGTMLGVFDAPNYPAGTSPQVSAKLLALPVERTGY